MRQSQEWVKDGPLTAEAFRDVLRRRIAPGLHAAHMLGIVHRDVSPDNIILPGGKIEFTNGIYIVGAEKIYFSKFKMSLRVFRIFL